MSGASAELVKDFINRQQGSLISLLRCLVEAESPSSQPAAHDRVRAILKTELADIGYHVLEAGPPEGPRHIYARPAHRARGRGALGVVGPQP